MSEQYPLTVFFDASCSLCDSEMQTIKLHDLEQRLVLIDCSAVDFDDAPFATDGVTREAMMNRLHVRDQQGAWIKGVAAFELIYRTVGMSAFADLWGSRMTRPIMEHLYPWVARHRQLLSLTGLPVLFTLLGKYEARRAYRRSQRCNDGQCTL